MNEFGAFVFTVTGGGFEPMFPDEVVELAEQYGFSRNVVPPYAGDRTILSRVLASTSSGLWKEDLLLRPITRTSTEVVYGIVRESRAEHEREIRHEQQGTVSWSAYPDSSVIKGKHAVALRVAKMFTDLRGKITHQDWPAIINKFFEKNSAAKVRDSVYWIPQSRIDDVTRFKNFLAELGINLMLLGGIGDHEVVKHIATHNLKNKLEKLQKEIHTFNGTQKPSTYSHRLEDLEKLHEQAKTYQREAGIDLTSLEQEIAELEEKITTMLMQRKKTVFHRDGTIEKRTIIQPPTTKKEKEEVPMPDTANQQELFK